MELKKITDIIFSAVSDGVLKKIVFSKASDKDILRSVAVVINISGKECLQLETFTRDNKAYHKNIGLEEGAAELARLALEEYMQVNIITSAGECEVKHSKSGKVFIGNKIKSGGVKIAALEHNRSKKYILDDHLSEPFLYHLGICDKNGRIHDKMQAKYRQINRFLETVRDISDKLPKDGVLTVYDLCCGKSYLSFALYFYLERILGREVEMLGADLKRDVIDYCNGIAERSGMKNLKFLCGDIGELGLKDSPDMVVSLHACDIATDIVIAHAIRSHAKIILSTPCCHHELFSKSSEMSHCIKESLNFVLSHSMSRQKLCEDLTDSLRAKTLEAYGYKTDMLELVTPDDTPKNLLIRAVLNRSVDGSADKGLAAARSCVGAELMLEKLLK